jgi:hypothetical protein
MIDEMVFETVRQCLRRRLAARGRREWAEGGQHFAGLALAVMDEGLIGGPVGVE